MDRPKRLPISLVAGSHAPLTGDVKVTSVSGDTITSEVDLKSDTSIKGPFTAKILTRK
jgi:hypothetical protein